MRLLRVLPLVLAACSATDPYERAGMWQPEGVNAGNIAAMLDHPADLVRGRGDRGPTRVEGQAAVARIWEGRERPLPTPVGTAETTAPAPANPPPPAPPAAH